MIERVEPRHGVLTRASRRQGTGSGGECGSGRDRDFALLQPTLKPHLIDRYLAAAEKGRLKPVLLFEQVDLADPAELQLVGAYALGVPVLLTSTYGDWHRQIAREQLRGRSTVFSGQSVGKSSLLNAVQPGLGLSVKTVGEVNNKGRHTTTYAQLLKLESGGWVVDTPGVRQLQLWDVIPEEVEGYFPDFPALRGVVRVPGLHPRTNPAAGEDGRGPQSEQFPATPQLPRHVPRHGLGIVVVVSGE
ncbi:MAG: ribosome small subunit-dependent GTPase A [Gemmataceae bacterium]